MKYILFLSALILLMAREQREIRVADMDIQWWYEKEELMVDVWSPARGWITIGFNEQDAIVGAELFMAGLHNGRPYLSERQVVAAGDHRAISSLGLQERARLIIAEEEEGRTHIQLAIRVSGDDRYQLILLPSSQLFLIAAYSVSDDLNHHSRQRAHISWPD